MATGNLRTGCIDIEQSPTDWKVSFILLLSNGKEYIQKRDNNRVVESSHAKILIICADSEIDEE